MTTIGTRTGTTDHILTVDCHQCHSRNRARPSHRLPQSSRSTYPDCGALFEVVVLTSGLSEHDPVEADRPSPAPPPAIPTGAHPITYCSFHGTGGTLWGMQIVNLCLNIMTLGAYHLGEG